MKITYLLAISLLLTIPALSQTPDLHDMVKKNQVSVVNRELTLINEDGRAGIRLSKEHKEGLAWLKEIDFSEGVIEFDVRGANIKQGSFVGIAFHGQNDSTFDAVYLRPFQFREADPVLQKRAIQYISLPEHTWRKLRDRSPGKYENSITPVPDPAAWTRMRIVVKGTTVYTYINGSNDPSLVVEKLTPAKSGWVGFYTADNSGGDFANITITKTN